ncbi:MAG: aminotransferase class IV, partial [Anaerolineae bacterium]|nr:aminotransferase class IV [Anaerolineae bacterium]
VSIPLKLNRPRLRAALRELLHQADYPDTKFRITVPRAQPDHLYLALEPFVPVPDAVMQGGAHVITVPLVRENPDAKTTRWMTTRRETQENLPPGVYEGLMVRADGIVLEGLSSNIFGVLNGVLRTAGEHVLAGITRRAVFEFAPAVLPVDLTPLHTRDLGRLSEAMLTSSGRGIVPITQIDGVPVGTGQSGPVVRELQTRYVAWTEIHSEPI